MNERLNLESAAELMKAMGNPVRIAILSQLADGKEKTTKEMTEDPAFRDKVSPSGISQHMAVLRLNDLVTLRREHPRAFYTLNSDRLDQAREVLEELKVTT